MSLSLPDDYAALKHIFCEFPIEIDIITIMLHTPDAYDGSKGKFSCELITSEGGWIRKIQVKIVGKR